MCFRSTRNQNSLKLITVSIRTHNLQIPFIKREVSYIMFFVVNLCKITINFNKLRHVLWICWEKWYHESVCSTFAARKTKRRLQRGDLFLLLSIKLIQPFLKNNEQTKNYSINELEMKKKKTLRILRKSSFNRSDSMSSSAMSQS